MVMIKVKVRIQSYKAYLIYTLTLHITNFLSLNSQAFVQKSRLLSSISQHFKFFIGLRLNIFCLIFEITYLFTTHTKCACAWWVGSSAQLVPLWILSYESFKWDVTLLAHLWWHFVTLGDIPLKYDVKMLKTSLS